MSNDKTIVFNDENAIVRVFKLWAKIAMMIVDGKRDAQAVADVLQGILDQSKVKILKFLGQVSVDIYKPVNLDEFLTARAGILIEEKFKEQIACDAQFLVEAVCLLKYSIDKNLNDRDIIAELPGGHIFEADEFCQVLPTMITKQWGGTDGNLINTGLSNLFYVWNKDKKQVFVVDVGWNSDDSLWGVNVWGLSSAAWRAGDVVFSRR